MLTLGIIRTYPVGPEIQETAVVLHILRAPGFTAVSTARLLCLWDFVNVYLGIIINHVILLCMWSSIFMTEIDKRRHLKWSYTGF